MNEILWLMMRQSHMLQTFRQDIVGVWADEAAQSINQRFLNPHANDDEKMRLAFQDQVLSLAHTQAEINRAQDSAAIAETHSQKVQDYLLWQQRETQEAYQYYEVALDSLKAAQSQLPQIETLIQQANRACGL